LRLLIGLWGATEQLTETTARLRESGADEVVTTLTEAVVQLSQYAAALAQEAVLLAPPSDETERLAELQNLHLLDTKAEPVFDRITDQTCPHSQRPHCADHRLWTRSGSSSNHSSVLPEDLAQARQDATRRVCSAVRSLQWMMCS
jgi:hypothetical protein